MFLVPPPGPLYCPSHKAAKRKGVYYYDERTLSSLLCVMLKPRAGVMFLLSPISSIMDDVQLTGSCLLSCVALHGCLEIRPCSRTRLAHYTRALDGTKSIF